jgi:hypothetical protein
MIPKRDCREYESVDWAYLNASDRTIANDGMGNCINSSNQIGKGITTKLPDDIENRTTP